MKKHSFDQWDIIGKCVTDKQRAESWDAFTNVCYTLGLKLRVTGGVNLTHQISCTEEDCDTVLELI